MSDEPSQLPDEDSSTHDDMDMQITSTTALAAHTTWPVRKLNANRPVLIPRQPLQILWKTFDFFCKKSLRKSGEEDNNRDSATSDSESDRRSNDRTINGRFFNNIP